MALYIDNERKNAKKASYFFPVRLLRWLTKNGYAPSSEAVQFLSHAARYAAPVTHPEGNRRYNDLLLTVRDWDIVDLAVFEPQCKTCSDTKLFVAYDPDGTERSWPCPDCRQVDKRRTKGNHRKLSRR